jgi:hypothetical protein
MASAELSRRVGKVVGYPASKLARTLGNPRFLFRVRGSSVVCFATV